MSFSFNIDTSHPTPLYHQLDRAIRFAIATGKLALGDQLPTVRQLAVDLRINANTVAKVYGELERLGIVETRRGVGTFVKARHFEAARDKDRERPGTDRGPFDELSSRNLNHVRRSFLESPARAILARQELVRLGDVRDLPDGGVPEQSPAAQSQ
jgi:GntR family transcriptional regulator